MDNIQEHSHSCDTMSSQWDKIRESVRSLLLNMLLLSRSMYLWKITYLFLIFTWLTVVSTFFHIQLPPLAPSVSHSSRSNVLPISYASVVGSSRVSRRRQFLLRTYQSNHLSLAGYCLEASSSLLYVQEPRSFSAHFIFSSTTFRGSPYFSSDIPNVQVLMQCPNTTSIQFLWEFNV